MAWMIKTSKVDTNQTGCDHRHSNTAAVNPKGYLEPRPCRNLSASSTVKHCLLLNWYLQAVTLDIWPTWWRPCQQWRTAKEESWLNTSVHIHIIGLLEVALKTLLYYQLYAMHTVWYTYQYYIWQRLTSAPVRGESLNKVIRESSIFWVTAKRTPTPTLRKPLTICRDWQRKRCKLLFKKAAIYLQLSIVMLSLCIVLPSEQTTERYSHIVQRCWATANAW